MNVFNEKDIELGKEEIEIIDDKKYVTFFRKGDDGIIYKHIKEYKASLQLSTDDECEISPELTVIIDIYIYIVIAVQKAI